MMRESLRGSFTSLKEKQWVDEPTREQSSVWACYCELTGVTAVQVFDLKHFKWIPWFQFVLYVVVGLPEIIHLDCYNWNNWSNDILQQPWGVRQHAPNFNYVKYEHFHMFCWIVLPQTKFSDNRYVYVFVCLPSYGLQVCMWSLGTAGETDYNTDIVS